MISPRVPIAALALAAWAPAAIADAPDATITRNGVGPITVGMTVVRAEEVSGLEFSTPRPAQCTFSSTQGLSMMLTGPRQRMARIDVTSPSFTTARTIAVGATIAEVKAAYPGVRTVPGKYVRRNVELWLAVRPSARTGRGMVFETDGAAVTTIRAGRMPELGYVEGCS